MNNKIYLRLKQLNKKKGWMVKRMFKLILYQIFNK